MERDSFTDRRRTDRIDMDESRSHRWRWAWALGLAGLLGGVAWLAYPTVQKHAGMLSEFPVVKQSLASASQRIDDIAAKVNGWPRDQETLREQLAKLEGSVADRIRAVSREAQRSRETVTNWVRAELDRRDGMMESRLSRMKTAHRDEVAALQAELARVKESIEQQQVRLAAVEANVSADKELAHQKLGGVRDRIDQQDRNVRELARSMETTRLDFEVSKNHSRQLSPGLWLGLTKTDVAHRRVSGWMWIMPDRKTVWLRDQGALQPVIYYSSADGKRREVVFTHVTKDAAVGYLLLPAGAPQLAKALGREGRPAAATESAY